MNDKQLKKVSKFLSLVLRHDPGKIGLEVDGSGWANVDQLLSRMKQSGTDVSMEVLKEVVRTNNKKRFSFSEDGKKIRANQGHSIDVDLGLIPIKPPELLFHGTATKFLDSIFEKGLIKGSRQHVHLSADEETAITVGRRHGKAIVISVDACGMQEAGHKFYQSDNGVWLVDHVPADFLATEKVGHGET